MNIFEHIIVAEDVGVGKRTDENDSVVYFTKEEIVLELNDRDDSVTLFDFDF